MCAALTLTAYPEIYLCIYGGLPFDFGFWIVDCCNKPPAYADLVTESSTLQKALAVNVDPTEVHKLGQLNQIFGGLTSLLTSLIRDKLKTVTWTYGAT